MSDTIEAVIFDLDNTLTDRTASIHRFSEQFYEDFCSDMDQNVTFSEVHRVISLGDGGGYRPKETMFLELQRDISWLTRPEISAIREYWYRVSAECMQLR
ncbi:MAG: hypothetical protein AAF653_21585, partial [Chloroflexota bacterium]